MHLQGVTSWRSAKVASLMTRVRSGVKGDPSPTETASETCSLWATFLPRRPIEKQHSPTRDKVSKVGIHGTSV